MNISPVRSPSSVLGTTVRIIVNTGLILNNANVIVGTRFHSIILGMLLNKGVIPIIYSDKTKHVLEDLKFIGKTVDIRDLDSVNIEDLFTEENINYRINIERIKKEAEEQFKELDKVLYKVKN